jgi:hypothetical protein
VNADAVPTTGRVVHHTLDADEQRGCIIPGGEGQAAQVPS